MPGKKVRFSARIQPIRGGGCYVVVPDDMAERAGLVFRDRVRGTVAGEPYRASLAKYSGEFHVAVLKSAMTAAGLAVGDEVPLTIERDAEPLPGDVLPAELERALDENRVLRAAWDRLPPSHRREHVKYVVEAKQEATRESRSQRVLKWLAEGDPRRAKRGS